MQRRCSQFPENKDNKEKALTGFSLRIHHFFKNWSGRRDLNPRPQPWQGCALPLSYTRIRKDSGARPNRLGGGFMTQSGTGCKRLCHIETEKTKKSGKTLFFPKGNLENRTFSALFHKQTASFYPCLFHFLRSGILA